jgi:hypothetical protein
VQNGCAEAPSAVVERLGKWEAAAKLAERLFKNEQLKSNHALFVQSCVEWVS